MVSVRGQGKLHVIQLVIWFLKVSYEVGSNRSPLLLTYLSDYNEN